VAVQKLFVWLGILAVVSAARYALKLAYHRSTEASDAQRWGNRFAIGSLASGLAWIPAVVMSMQSPSVLLHAITIIIVAGLVAGAATTTASYRPCYYAFTVPLIGVLTAMLIATQQREYVILAGITVLFAVFVSGIACRLNRSLANAFSLHHKNDELVAELQSALSKVNQSNRAKSDFLANMSHELRTPLNAIIGFSGMIMSEALGPIGSPRYKEYAGDIQESGAHLLGLISNILDVSKIEAGQVNLQTAEIDIEDVIHACLTIIKDRARDERVALAVNLAPDLPILIADQTKLKQVLINLLTNAVKFTPSGGSVSIAVEWSEPTGYTIKVIDTGIGIEPADIPKALAAFHQVESKEKSGNEGTGLGLTLAKSLVELHGGDLSLSSEVGVGTTVTVVFPSTTVVERQASPRAISA